MDQQAQLASDTVKLRDVIARFANASLKRVADLEEKSSALVDAQMKSDGKISALVDAQTKSEVNISALAEAQTYIDERLNTFIAVVERYINRNQKGNTHR